MGTINVGGVIKGGLVAGLLINISETVLNVPVLGARMEAELAARNLPPVGNGAIGLFVAEAFVMGLLTVWLYAAIRPRLGAGPKTAVYAGLFVWVLSTGYSALAFGVMGISSSGVIVISLAWTFVEMIIASTVGAYLYSE